VDALLAADTDNLTAHAITSEATWADKYRITHRETSSWHFTDIEIADPDLKAACNGRQPLPPGKVARVRYLPAYSPDWPSPSERGHSISRPQDYCGRLSSYV
jgi:hypothetical protein